MKTSRYFLVLPFAITALVTCGGDNYKSISYEDACSMADNYTESIKSSKAQNIVVSGHINKIALKGDATWWSYETDPDIEVVPVGGGEVAEKVGTLSLWSMIPNFSVKNSEINVDPQDLVAVSLPASLAPLAATFNPSNEDMIRLIGNLPKFPMNHNLLKAIKGIKELKTKQDGSSIDWDNIDQLDWKQAKVSFYSSGGKLKVTVDIEDTLSFIDEIQKRLMPSANPINDEPSKIIIPGSISLTTNQIGYIDSLSVNVKMENIDKEFSRGELYYLHVKGDLEVNVNLKFEQVIASPITIKYQLCEYRDPEDTELPDVSYNGQQLKLDKIVSPTTSLDTLKEYVSFDWYSNVSSSGVIKHVYDDRIFNFDYWNLGSKNVAFTNEAYDVLVKPACDSYSYEKYQILGANYINSVSSLISTSANGRKVSVDTGFDPDMKALINAGDLLTTVLDEKIGYVNADEIYINSNLLNVADSEFIVNIAVKKISW